ncbi:MAG: anaerobic ribonucleoside-triphosphate reductase activating protein [Rikenellaceae bacterium]|nr:anaerobic ribonucleoside-triphosphate reductase activating protein [Rikenellaceae bacterium]
MLRLASYDIVFQEIPGEATLALNLSGCPNRCPGCHSPHLQQELGEALDDELLSGLLDVYGSAVTCVCFMGGDGDPAEVERLARQVRLQSAGTWKTGWYSGKEQFPPNLSPNAFDYVKLGSYQKGLGGLDSVHTNQRLYRITEGRWKNITELLQRRP